MAWNHKEEFGLVWDYAHELRSKMLGSTIKMVVQRVTVDSLPHFKRYYICFDALKRGWKARCRLLIRLDGYFLKGPFKNKFLTAVRRNANNQMFPITWAVVEIECTDSWSWFLSLLSTDLGLEDRYGYTIISDQQKTRAFLGATCKSDIVDNNLREAFNSSIVETRFKSIIKMLEDIRTKMTTRIVQKKKLCNGWKQNYGPLVKAKFDANKKDYVEWQLIWYGENGYELRNESYQYTVDLSQRICSCRSWQISGIPCSYACAAMYHLGLQPDEYKHKYYHIDTYKKAYSFLMQPINRPHDWEITCIQPVLPAIERKMSGKPKKNRRMAKNEPKKLKPGHLSRKGLLMTCTQCG
ncbi:hypothetical protein J1N35_038686 [Gossypium stocksii]|uniref:SWIM-type domain-containing protein n=1 Tax=Gossypium stocksii TaxID=47602 RepID=A0A9D3UME1_9ROSI|nr:hypothetical protein J1N35_038686 [Gossypium stocksii]